MRTDFLHYLRCPSCDGHSFTAVAEKQNKTEIREGFVFCRTCKAKFAIHMGVLDFLMDPSPIVEKGRKGWKDYDLLPNALPFRVEDAHRYEKQILSLPDGDDSDFFENETLFRSIVGAKHAFYQGLTLSGLTGGERLLDLGADICWSTYKFAQLGCDCVALDINHHLPVSDIYVDKGRVYFERAQADMCDLPFVDESFDVVVTVTSIHHTHDLGKTFREMARVLSPGGKVVLINEPMRGVFQQKDYGGADSKELALNDHWYTAREYRAAAKKVGLDLIFRLCLRPVMPSDTFWHRTVKTFINHRHWISNRLNFPVPILQFIPAGVTMIGYPRERSPHGDQS